jgi:L-asparaginase
VASTGAKRDEDDMNPASVAADAHARGIVVLATGGTIAGVAASATDNLGYASAQRGVQELVQAVPGLAAWPVEAEQLAQVDSKDMSHALWARLVERVRAHLARPEVKGLVVTHGTDTLEETAWLLHRTVGPALHLKPVVLTAAMRPATSLQADGPQNLLDAITLAAEPASCGVLLALAGWVWAGLEVRKVHSYRADAFAAGDAGPVGQLVEGRLRRYRPWPVPEAGPPPHLTDDTVWPWVEIVATHAGAGPRAVHALLAAGVQGLVVACTGNGSVHGDLEAALVLAQAQGVPVLRATRCPAGGIVEGGGCQLPSAGLLTPAQARVELMLRLLADR